MEKKDTITKKACKKQASFENKGASIAWARQKEGGVPVPCNMEIDQQWLVLKSAYLSRFYIIILHLKYQ